jgi:spermidine synthase
MNRKIFHKVVISGLILVGFTSMVAQIVLMRELLIIFYGNELSLGITLAGWLFWGGMGSLVVGPLLGRKIRRKLLFFTGGELLLSIFIPLSLILVRFLPHILRVASGEIIGTIPMLVSSFVCVSFVTFPSGALFVLGCEIYREREEEKAVPIGYVYVMEAVGATLGGVMASFLLIKFLPALMIMLLLSLLNVTIAFLLQWKREKLSIVFSSILFLVFGISSLNVQKIRTFTLENQWSNYRFIESRNSIYQNITVVERNNAISFFTNGLIAFTVPDTATVEKKVHLPMLEHPSPKEVLILEGGMSGIIDEILKYPVRRIDYVEIDPIIIEMGREYLNFNEWKEKNVNIINMDGRFFVKRTKSSYDVAIVNLPEPHTAQTNRFYTVEFYRELKKILNSEGIVCFSIYSNPNYMSEEARNLYLSLKKTLESVFEDVMITPGGTNFFLASKSKGVLTDKWEVLLERLQKRGINARYMREYYLFADFSEERFEYFENRLETENNVILNSDFRPISYYYDMVFWSTYFSRLDYLTRKVLKSVTQKRTWIFLICISIALLLPLFRKRRSYSYGVLVPIGTTGFAEMTFQVVTLLAFQILYGYVFYKLTLILSSYMLGLIIGGVWITRLIERGKGTVRTYFLTQVSIVIYPLVLPLLFFFFARTGNYVVNFIGSDILFPLLPVIPGLIGGFQFPLANKLFVRERVTKGTSAGITYGLDLGGACLGAFLVSIFLIPIIGIHNTCFQVSILNFVSLILIVVLLRPFNPFK